MKAAGGQGRRILVVDDIASNRRLLRATLEAEGYTVFEAVDGVEALAQLEHHAPVQAVISDILMPNMDGYRLCSEIRKSERWRSLPFVFYTSTYLSASDESLAHEMGGDAFLTKPASADKILSTLAEAVARPRPPAEVATLPQELETMRHYSGRLVAKLEEQNAALRISEERLRTREQQLRLFVEYAPAAIAMLDRDMRYLAVSKRWSLDYRLPDGDLVGRSHYEVFPEVPERWKDVHRRCLAGATERREADRFERANGVADWVRWEIHPWRRTDGEVGGLIIFTEVITAKVEAERALRDSRERFMGIVSTAMDAIVAIDENHHIVLFNPAAEKVFGYPAETVMGKPIEMLVPDRHRAVHAGHVRRFAASGVTSRMMRAPGTVFGRRADGTEVPLEASISQIVVDGKHVYTAILRDISQRLRVKQDLHDAAQRLRELAHRLVAVQESEQRRLSAEIHDRIGQNLTALGINLKVVADALEAQVAPGTAARLRDSLALLESTTASVRHLIGELRPPELKDYGLLAALRTLAAGLRARTGLAVEVSGEEPSPRLSLSADTSLYRIAQEALNNVAKHARAGRVEVRLVPADGGVELVVADDGIGFDAQGVGPEHWGLDIMRERAEAAGAKLRVESRPGAGTTITVMLARSE